MVRAFTSTLRRPTKFWSVLLLAIRTNQTGSGDYTPLIINDWGQPSCRNQLVTYTAYPAGKQCYLKGNGGKIVTLETADEGPEFTLVSDSASQKSLQEEGLIQLGENLWYR